MEEEEYESKNIPFEADINADLDRDMSIRNYSSHKSHELACSLKIYEETHWFDLI